MEIMKYTKLRELLASDASLDKLDWDLAQGRIDDGARFMLRGEPSIDFKLCSSFFRGKRYKSISLKSITESTISMKKSSILGYCSLIAV